MDLNPVGILKTERRRRGIVVETETENIFKLRQERNMPPRLRAEIG